MEMRRSHSGLMQLVLAGVLLLVGDAIKNLLYNYIPYIIIHYL